MLRTQENIELAHISTFTKAASSRFVKESALCFPLGSVQTARFNFHTLHRFDESVRVGLDEIHKDFFIISGATVARMLPSEPPDNA